MNSPSDHIDDRTLSFVEKLDLEKQRGDKEIALKEQDTLRRQSDNNLSLRKARAQAWMWFGVAVVTLVAVVGVAWVIWQGTKGPSDKDQRNQEQYQMCVVQKGGTWIPADTDHGPICVADGKVETK